MCSYDVLFHFSSWYQPNPLVIHNVGKLLFFSDHIELWCLQSSGVLESSPLYFRPGMPGLLSIGIVSSEVRHEED